jgi:hypothetical protein
MGRFLGKDNRWAALRWSRAGRTALAVAAALAITVAFAVSACLDEPFSECESGLICARGQRCATEGDYCVDIRSREECGDGFHDGDEGCDCGEEASDTRPAECEERPNADEGGYCKTTCELHCGDGQLAGEELCDGNQFLAEISCVSLGYDINHLSCADSCSLIEFEKCSYIGWREQVARNQLARSPLRQVWVIDDTHAIAVGGGSGSARIVSYAEGSGSIQDASSATGGLNDVWASATDDAFAVGGSAGAGQILHYDGTTWTESPVVAGGELVAIWGATENDVIAVGDQGIIVHYDGMEWSPRDSGTTSRLAAVWGSGSDDVFAAGAGGVIVHYDGNAWSQMVSGTDVNLTALWGVDGGLVYAAGENGVLLRYDGAWSQTSSPTGLSWRDLWGVGADRIFALDESSTIYFHDGASWYTLDHIQGIVSGLGGTDVTNLFAVGNVGGNGMIWKNHGFSLVDTERPQPDLAIADVWGSDDANVFAVGDSGMILHYDGNSAGTFSEMTSPTTARLTGVWGNSADDVFAVGDGGVILHYDGDTWSEMTVPTTNVLHAVWSASADLAFAVGEKEGSGVILRYDGSQWIEEKTVSAHHFDAIGGNGSDNVVAVGAQGAMYQFDGTSWVELSSPTEAELTAVWVGASDEIVVATFVGEIWHSADGVTWSLRETSSSVRVNDLAGSDANDLYAAGDGIWHYDGSTWEPVRSQTGTITAVWVLSTGQVLFAGVEETIRTLYRL